ncbi:CBS domain-containing protein [Haloplasma contractile]|uniref:IMP dehydrogenase protein n=1 Tax=Haloplasma contractile SSD-17B TaxID=1033810 RepID=U2FQR3_9MOLU|nr:CBS domain-containing protein [Haloplasma contractile]ERJ13364.1 IMP dehydrogenase protein [Haloplasma contractile SSD-17B]
MQVHELMTHDVVCLYPDDTVRTAAEYMAAYNIGCLPVINDDRRVVGVLTDRDIVLRCIHLNKPYTVEIDNIMTTQVFMLKPTDEVATAAHIMGNHQIRRIPVVDEVERLIGIIALGDISTHEMSDAKAGRALSDISMPESYQDSNPYYGVNVDDFRL